MFGSVFSTNRELRGTSGVKYRDGFAVYLQEGKELTRVPCQRVVHEL